ncbi:hypothetical protein VTL71DRAFT_7076 [Oculimacula yallundae]
MPIP